MHRLIDHALAHLAIRLDRATRTVDMLALRRLLARYDTSVYAPRPASFLSVLLPSATDDSFDDLA